MERATRVLVAGFVLGLILLSPSFGRAEEENTQELKAQIEALQKRVAELEASSAGPGLPLAINPPGVGRMHDPFAELQRLQAQMDQMFQNSFQLHGPAMPGLLSSRMSYDTQFDIKDQGDVYVVTLDLQGLDTDQVDIDINAQSISVKGEISRKQEKSDPNQQLSFQGYSSFMRSFPLPADADTSKVRTEHKDEQIIITIPKKNS